MILITGGLGFLGTGLARYLLDQGEEVVLTRRRNPRVPAMLAADLDRTLHIVDCDLLDFPSIIGAIKKYRVTSIIHAAVGILAKASVYQAVKTNMEGTVNVLEAARLTDIGRITVTSSNTVYFGFREPTVCREDMAVHIDVNQPIASEKIATEAICNLYAHEYKIDVLITRPSMIYGPGSLSVIAPLALIVESVLRDGKAVMPRFHPEWGTDFVYIKDCSRAIGILHLAEKPTYRVYNAGSGKSHTLSDVVRAIRKVIPDCTIELSGTAPGPLHRVDIGRLRDEFGYEPEYDLERGISEYIGWVKKGKP